MASETTNVLSQDIFQVSNFLEAIKQKYIDISEDTLYLGVYGYLSSVLSNLTQNTAIMASEYSLEAIPTKAKYERNVISHALALGINKITATPAQLDVILAFPEENLIQNMVDDKVTIDKDYTFLIGDRNEYPYRLDYDITIKRNILPNGKIVYTAMYELDDTNPYASKTNPYLPSLGTIQSNNQRLISIKTTLRQLSHTILYDSYASDNIIQTKTMSFSFEDQLAYFYVKVKETDNDGNIVEHVLKPIYEGLYDYQSDDEFINYTYIDEKNIRLKFNKSSYQPRYNSEIEIHVYTTLGTTCNYELTSPVQVLRILTSDRFTYNGFYVSVITNSSSMYGEDRANLEQLKQLIPREALARGSYSTYTDLMTFFNIIQTEDCKMTVLERVYNQIEHIFFSYLLMKMDGNVIPTNTIDVQVDSNIFTSTSKDNHVISPGIPFHLAAGSEYAVPITDEETDYERLENKHGFVYTCPYLMVINKNPFYLSYYNIFVNYTRTLFFDYINEESDLQFVVDNMRVYRNYFDNEKGELHIQIAMAQNIETDYDILTFDESGELIECAIKPIIVLYNSDEDRDMYEYRYIVGNLIEYDANTSTYLFDFVITTSNVMGGRTTHMMFNSGLYNIGTTDETPSYLMANMPAKLFILVKEDAEHGRKYGDKSQYSVDDLVPGLEGYTLTNIYEATTTGIDFFYDYTDLMTSYIQLNRNKSKFVYNIHSIPVVRTLWLDSEDKVQTFFYLVDYRRRYIQESLYLLEDSFGINFKLYNTYGPSSSWNIDKYENIDRVNISLKFEIKFATRNEVVLIPEIIQVIKAYIEDFNSTDKALHMPNLITYVKNLYTDSIEYIKFIGLNSYSNILWQSIYQNPVLKNDYFAYTQTVPEFINVHTLTTGDPDITFNVVE